ncbi:Synaptogenesis protein syg-2 [Holothuria leucospilota]|uniref:Synaptogenesis protein syg-2 n=1 Tax=Holothuria leucospilota TaxID=206669 RepID=A0A9Q1BJT4_HOLLE|nr:Synaptogenesis protein syg-2 [Holothuria leucospilota]
MGCIIGETNSEFTITWMSHGNNIMHHSTSKELLKIQGRFKSVIKNNKSNASLHISNIIFEDAGEYDCSVTFHRKGPSQSMSWILIVQGRPKINISSLIIENKPTAAECCIKVAFAMNRSDMEIIWRIGREILHSEILPGEHRTTSVTTETVCSNAKLILTQLHHGRMLQCFVRNELHVSGRVRLNVTYLTNADVIVGSSYNPSDAVKVRKDEIVNITCIFQGNPSPNISLQRRNMENDWINTSMQTYPVKQTITMTSQTFLYESAQEKSVRFKCTAYNGIGSATQSKEFQIEVLGKSELPGYLWGLTNL